jgi:hypothetical protein
MSEKVQTAFGEAELPALVRAYESLKRADERKKAWLKTDRGKEWNREKAAAYYNTHKDEILARRKESYSQNSERQRKYYQEHRDALLERAKAYRERKKAEATAEIPA